MLNYMYGAVDRAKRGAVVVRNAVYGDIEAREQVVGTAAHTCVHIAVIIGVLGVASAVASQPACNMYAKTADEKEACRSYDFIGEPAILAGKCIGMLAVALRKLQDSYRQQILQDGIRAAGNAANAREHIPEILIHVLQNPRPHAPSRFIMWAMHGTLTITVAGLFYAQEMRFEGRAKRRCLANLQQCDQRALADEIFFIRLVGGVSTIVAATSMTYAFKKMMAKATGQENAQNQEQNPDQHQNQNGGQNQEHRGNLRRR